MEVVVYGVSTAYAADVAETLRRLGATVLAFVVNVEAGSPPDGLAPLVHVQDLDPSWVDAGIVFAMVTPGYRQQIETEVRAHGASRFPPVVDPTAIVASSTVIDEGVSVNAGAVIGANTTLGRFSLVNRSVSIGHDVVLREYATLGPACVLCGSVDVGAGAFVGAGAVLNPGVSIGANAIVGAGAVVVRDVPPNTVVVGNPATVTREDVAGYNGVSVTWT